MGRSENTAKVVREDERTTAPRVAQRRLSRKPGLMLGAAVTSLNSLTEVEMVDARNGRGQAVALMCQKQDGA